MARPPSCAQRAVQITFVLKGHLKNVQVAYIRVAALLVKVRDERLYRGLGHQTMEQYAAVAGSSRCRWSPLSESLVAPRARAGKHDAPCCCPPSSPSRTAWVPPPDVHLDGSTTPGGSVGSRQRCPCPRGSGALGPSSPCRHSAEVSC